MPRSSPAFSPRPRTLPNAGRRVNWLAGVLLLWMAVVVGRLYSLQIIQYTKWVFEERKQQDRTRLVRPVRGALFDRNLHPLAISEFMDSVYAKKGKVSDYGGTADALASVLGLDAGQLEKRLRSARSDYRIKWGLSKDLAARVRSLNLGGILTEKELERVYPAGSLAASVTGYAGVDDQGLSGVEKTLDPTMAGRPGRVLVVNDAHQRIFQSTGWQGQAGSDVILTIDENITRFAEEALTDAVDRWHATGGTVIVEDPATGDVLALVSVPTFDPNDYEHANPEARLNRATQWVYEPGSVFKLVTLSAALDLGLTDPRKIIDCQMGHITLYGHVIHDHERFGDLSVEDVLVHSSDVGAIKIGLLLGDDRFYQYIRRYGFGEPTGIELPREEPGLLQPPHYWSGISVAAISIGQEISVTAAQLISAYAAIANGGVRLPPRLVRDVNVDGKWVPRPRSPGRRVVSERTSEIMKQMLEAVVDRGTGKLTAQLSGYSAAGKTGTAQKIVNGVYSHHIYVDSFVGFAPVEHPGLVVLVSIDSPSGGAFGGTVAGPVFKTVMEQSLTYLKVPKDRPDLLIADKRAPRPSAAPKTPPVDDDGPADLVGENEPDSSSAGAVKTVAFNDPGSTPVPDPGTVLIAKGPPVTVPDFTGLAVRPVADQCASAGLALVVSGTGLAVEQDPVAGSKVPPGTKVQVRFAR